MVLCESAGIRAEAWAEIPMGLVALCESARGRAKSDAVHDGIGLWVEVLGWRGVVLLCESAGGRSEAVPVTAGIGLWVEVLGWMRASAARAI